MNEENTSVVTEEKEIGMNPPEIVQDTPESVSEPENTEENPVETNQEERSAEEQKPDKAESPAEKAKAKYDSELKALTKKEERYNFEREETRDWFFKRFEEDPGLAEDFLAESKKFSKCFTYMMKRAEEVAAKGERGMLVEQTTIFEWIEDYIRKDDKAEAEEEKKQKAQEKKERELRAAKAKERKKNQKPKEDTAGKADTAEEKPEPKPKKKSDEIEGQMDIFSMFG